MPSITINIAAPSPLLTADAAGSRRMWLELDDGNANTDSISSYGWHTAASALPGRSGSIGSADHDPLWPTSYSRTLSISDEQHQKIKAFAAAPLAHGMTPDYDLLNHNSVSFIWLALQAGGLEPAGFTDRIWPAAHNRSIDSHGLAAADISFWHTAEAQAFVSELFQQSQELVTSNWKSTQMSSLQKQLANRWQLCADEYDHARIVRYDPLALDLDGDGLETRSVTSNICFDHDGDGIRTATGWIAADDGLLVMDRNNNGMIDNGSELFGDNTVLASGNTASDGFAALADQDSNQDGIVDSSDTGWNQIKIWRDLDQDGLSQEHELFTPEQLNIASLSLAVNRYRQTLDNGNQIADSGHYLRGDGSRGDMADVNFREQAFFRRFTDAPAISAAVMQLPEVAGSGKVRDLRAAAMQSTALRETLTRYSRSSTRTEQRSLLEQLLSDWAASAGMASRLQERIGSDYRIEWRALGSDTVNHDEHGARLVTELERKLAILDAFNGRHFFDVQNGKAVAFSGFEVREGQHGQPGAITITLSPQQLNLLNQTYAILQETVYGSLLIQTRFQPLFDLVQTSIVNNRVQLDFNAVEQYFEQALASNRIHALTELIDFYQYANLTGLPQWRADLMLARQLQQRTNTPEEQQLFAPNGISSDQRYEWRNNLIIGTIAGEWVFGNNQNDLIHGDAGNDALYGFDNDDLLDGGSGDDFMTGGQGNDIYLLRRNAGHDYIDNTEHEYHSPVAFDANPNADATLHLPAARNGNDIVIFEDMAVRDLRPVKRVGNHMQLEYGSADSVTILHAFVAADCEIDAFHFAGNVILNTHQLLNEVGLEAEHLDAANDFLQLSRFGDLLFAGDGHDTIDGAAGDDRLSGEDDNDLLFGNGGDDFLDGGTGDDLLIGGSGNDIIIAASGADVIALNRGDGADTVRMSAAASGNTVSLGGGISYGDLQFEKSNRNLILNLGLNDTITFENWYLDSDQQGIARLQMLTENGNGYNSASDAALHNQKVVVFDFTQLVTQFDTARTADPQLGRWTLSPALQQAHLSGSDIDTIGGERAYRYGRQLPFLTPASAPGFLQAAVQTVAAQFASNTNPILTPA